MRYCGSLAAINGCFLFGVRGLGFEGLEFRLKDLGCVVDLAQGWSWCLRWTGE